MSSKDIMDDTYFPTDEELNAGVAKLINYNAMLALINECLVVLVELVRLHDDARSDLRDPETMTEIRDNIEHNLLPQIQRIYDMEDDLEDEIGKLRMLGKFGQDSIH